MAKIFLAAAGLIFGFGVGIAVMLPHRSLNASLVQHCRRLKDGLERLPDEQRTAILAACEKNQAMRVKWEIVYAVSRVEIGEK